MTTVVHIIIMGMVGLLPTQNQYGEKGLVISIPAVEGKTPPHIPVIVFPTKDGTYKEETYAAACALDLIGNLDNATGLLDNGCKGCAAIVLKGETIGVKPLVNGALDFAEGRGDSPFDFFAAVPQNIDEAKDFSWLPRMKHLAGHSIPMKDYLYDPDYQGPKRAGFMKIENLKGSVWVSHIAEVDEPPDGCKAVVDKGNSFKETLCTEPAELAKPDIEVSGHGLPGGHLTSSPFVRFVRALSFSHNGFPIGSPRQALGDEVTIELPASSSTITLNLSGRTPIELLPRGGVVNILIANITPLPDNRNPGKCRCETIKTWPRNDPSMICRAEVGHFMHYYEMTDSEGEFSDMSIHFGLDRLRIEGAKVNRRDEDQPDVVWAVSKGKGPIHGGVGRPLCTPLGFD